MTFLLGHTGQWQAEYMNSLNLKEDYGIEIKYTEEQSLLNRHYTKAQEGQ